MKRLAIILVLAVSLAIPSRGVADGPLDKSVAFLKDSFNQVPDNGKDWIALALASVNEPIDTGHSSSTDLIDLARSALAKSSQRQDDASITAAIKATANGNQLGSPTLVNEDIFALLALQATDPNYLRTHPELFRSVADSQRADGSFGYATTGDTDVDMTAAALWALRYTPIDLSANVAQAFSYLDSAKKSDGSFGVRPGFATNIASTSWALLAYRAYGKSSADTTSFLNNSRQADGSWYYAEKPSVLLTAYAVMALSGKTMPIPPRQQKATNSGGDKGAAPLDFSDTTNPSPKSSSPAASNNAAPAEKRINSNSPTTKPKSRIIYRQVIIRQPQVTCTASASASASASGATASATASASASCW